jgi:hypothetical protein
MFLRDGQSREFFGLSKPAGRIVSTLISCPSSGLGARIQTVAPQAIRAATHWPKVEVGFFRFLTPDQLEKEEWEMLDPLGGFNRIRELYISYLDTAFRVRRPALAECRRTLLRTSGTLTTEPFLEPVPRYETSRFALEDLVDLEAENPIGELSRNGRRAFAELAMSGLFPGTPEDGEILRRHIYKPYRHQLKMLARGVQRGRPGIVTSGTR